MRTLVESLRRLYLAGKVTVELLLDMEADGKIDNVELNYILDEGVLYER